MVNCPGCGAANTDDATNCVACNHTLQINCPKCEYSNSVADIACKQCGYSLVANANSETNDNNHDDLVGEMFSEQSLRKTNNSSPKKAIIMLVLGFFVFAVIFLTKMSESYFYIKIIVGLIGGIIALLGLIELTFWFIDEKNLVDGKKVETPEKIENDFPEDSSLEVASPVTSLEETDKDIEISSKASGEIAKLDNSTPIEAVPEQVTKAPSADKHYDTLAEFLEDGITTEISEVKEKLAKSPNDYASTLHLAQLLEEKGETEEAISNLESCIKRNPNNAEVFLYYGTILRQKGRLNEARKAFEKALEINKFMSKAFYQLGLLEKTKENLEEARELFQKSIQLLPDDAYAHYQLGMTYKDLGKIDLAIMEVKRATILHPTDSYGHSRLGQFYQQLNKYDLAIASYSMALSLKPKDAFVLEKLAEVVASKGEHNKAIELFQDVLAGQFQQNVGTMMSLAKSLKVVGRWRDLQDLTSEILRLETDNYDAAFLMAYAIAKQGRLDDATNMFEALVANKNATYEAWLELGKLYQASGQTDKAIVAFTKAANGAPDQAGIWNNIGILLSNQKLFAEALKAFKKAASFDYTDQTISVNLKAVQKKIESDASRIIENRKRRIEKNPNDIEAYLDIGKAYESVEIQDEAFAAYSKVLALDPKYIPGLICYSELLRKMGKLKMAMRCYKEIIKLEPKNLDAHLFIINANLNLGFVNEAYKYASIAEKLAPDDSRVHFLLGKIYFSKGLAPRALKEFTKVANSVGDPDLISWAELMRKRLSRTSKQ